MERDVRKKRAWLVGALFFTGSLVASCGPSVPPPEPPPLAPLDALASHGGDPLVIATEPSLVDPTVDPPPPPASDACALSLRRAPRPDCRAVFPLGITASANTADASRASDGDTCTAWTSGSAAPQSVTIDLGVETRIDAIVLVPEMSPSGTTAQAIAFSKDGRTFEVGDRIEAPLANGVAIDLLLPKPETTRFVRVTTERSPSAVAWREIGLFRCGS